MCIKEEPSWSGREASSAEAPKIGELCLQRLIARISKYPGKDDIRLAPGVQATRIQMVLANGTVQDFTPQSASHLWRAAQARLTLCPLVTIGMPDVSLPVYTMCSWPVLPGI